MTEASVIQHRSSSIGHPTILPSSVSACQPWRGLPSQHPSSLDSTSLFLRIELESSTPNPTTNLGITLSSQELDARYNYTLQVQDSLSLSPGEFLGGTMGLQLGEIKIPFQGDFGRLQIKLDSQILLQNIWVQPNDSLRLSIDQRTGKLLFLGPHKEKFRLQVQLQDLASAWTKTINPIMLTSSKERILDSPEKVTDYQKIIEIQSFGWNRKMELLSEDSERLQRAKFLLNSAGQDHPVFQELIRYRDQLDPEHYDWLWLHWKGKLRKQALDFMLLTQASSPEWGQLLLENALEAEELSKIESIREFPMEFTEALYVEHYLLEIYTGISFTHLTETLPADLQNQVNAFFLVRQYKDLADADSLISELLDRPASPWIKEYLQGILLANLQGSEFINEPFWNEQGDPVYPESWKGKLVFLDFWLSGCGACLAFAKNKFLPLLEEFGSHPDILFVTITGDSDRELWKSTLAKNQLTTAQTLDLFAGGVTHPALKQYHVQAFPEQLLLDKEGKILRIGGFPSDLQGWKELLYAYLSGGYSKLTSLTQPQFN
jgi:thiol-disulfide isomerase/thioredoxin